MQPAAHDDPEAPARRALARYRGFATALLVLMAALMLLSFYLPPGWEAELLQASAKAGLIGGIADWFAVTALFRHPLGLPIPHTAILPRQKERLGRALGRFIARYVVTEAEIGRILARLDIPGILHNFLADPVAARPAAEAIAATLPRLLATIEDGRARRLAARIIPRLLGGAGAGRIVGRALRGLVEGGRHQEVLGFVLVELKKALAGREDALRVAIEERVREQGGRLVGWAMGASIARRVLGTINAELDRMGPDGSEIRAAFDEWVRREIERIETDPQRAAEIGLGLRRLVAHDTVQAWVWDVWSRLRRAMEADAGRPNGRAAQLIEGALANLGELLAHDEAARARVQLGTERMLVQLLPAAQANLADFIADVIGGWDTATLTDRLELRVGKDLQYVRVNGTLVGFLIGGLLYAALHVAYGAGGF
jgi:uncharacterized membrane-anchored protein YjiN (DUF445 family)